MHYILVVMLASAHGLAVRDVNPGLPYFSLSECQQAADMLKAELVPTGPSAEAKAVCLPRSR